MANDRLAADRFLAGIVEAGALGGAPLFFLRAFLLALAALAGLAAMPRAWFGGFAATAPAFGALARVVPLLGLAALVARRKRPGWPAAVAAGIGAGALVAGTAG